MSNMRLVNHSRERVRQFILDMLGERPAGCTQGTMLSAYMLSGPAPWKQGRYDPEVVTAIIDELVAMRASGQIVARAIDGVVVHQQAARDWLVWARAKQEEEARGCDRSRAAAACS